MLWLHLLTRGVGCQSLSGVHKLEKGHVIMGLVQKLDPNLGLLVKLPFSAMGTVAMEDLADKYKPKPLERYSKDQLVRSVAHFLNRV